MGVELHRMHTTRRRPRIGCGGRATGGSRKPKLPQLWKLTEDEREVKGELDQGLGLYLSPQLFDDVLF